MRGISGVFLIVALLAGWGIGSPASAAENSARKQSEAEAFKLNIAGRQRMLTQRISKAACLTHMGVDAVLHESMARDASMQFRMTLTALRIGNPGRGLEPEQSRAVLIQLDKTEALWEAFEPFASRAAGKTPDLAALKEVHARNVILLKQMNRTVSAIQAEMDDGQEASQLSRALNIAGRQRMLSQKAVKDLCFLSSGNDTENDRKALTETAAEFENTLHELRAGNAARNLIAAPSWEIDAQLEMVENLWFEMAPIIQTAIAGGDVSKADLGYAAFIAEAVLNEMNTAVLMYEKL